MYIRPIPRPVHTTTALRTITVPDGQNSVVQGDQPLLTSDTYSLPGTSLGID